jgi:hypothetical protein
MHDLEHQPEDSEDVILLPSKNVNYKHRTADTLSRWLTWATLGHSVLAVIFACALYTIVSAGVSGQRNVHGLRKPNQFPGLALVSDLRQQQNGA